jgi:hypothetical protein
MVYVYSADIVYSCTKMVFLPASILVLLYALPISSLVCAQNSSSGAYFLPNEITNIVPLCAQSCFTNFLQSNYPTHVCSNTPTLDCLCSHSSTSGYTAGEGAVQCILLGQNANFCQGSDISSNTVKNAYTMCFGKANSLPNTHGTITASLVVQTTLPSVVVAPSASNASSIPTSILTASSPSSTVDDTTTTSSASSSSSVSGTPTAQGASQSTQSTTVSTALTGPQIAGIAVSCGAVAVVTLTGLLVCACLRRRKRLANDDDSDFGTFQEDNGNSMEAMFRSPVEKKKVAFAPGGTANGLAARVPPQRPPRLDTDPNLFSRKSLPTEEIGIALSPEITQHSPDMTRNPSRLLPEKPSLKMLVPPQPGLPNQSHPYFISPSGNDPTVEAVDHARDSVLTQFEEEYGSPEPRSGHLSGIQYGYAYGHQNLGLWPRNNGHRVEPSRSYTVPPEVGIRPLDIRKSQSNHNFSQPRPRTGGCSMYSEPGASVPPPLTAVSRNPSGSTIQTWQHNNIHQQFQSYRPNPYPSDGGSITSIESTAEFNHGVTDHTVDLSPVVESPVGRSPVSYPRIKDRLSDDMIKRMDPPPQPNFQPWRKPEIEQTPTWTNEHTQVHFAASEGYKRRPNDAYRDSLRKSTETSDDKLPSSPLATRRGNKLAPALHLAGDPVKSKEGMWRVISDDERENTEMRSSEPWQPKLTPRRIGDDLFLNVQTF